MEFTVKIKELIKSSPSLNAMSAADRKEILKRFSQLPPSKKQEFIMLLLEEALELKQIDAAEQIEIKQVVHTNMKTLDIEVAKQLKDAVDSLNKN